MAAVTHLTPPASTVSAIIREMTRSISEILGDTKLEPLEIELRRSRLHKSPVSRPSSLPHHTSSRPPSTAVKPLSPSLSHHDDTPHTKVLDMLRPFCQPVDDFLPGGKVSGDLGPIVGHRVLSQPQPPRSSNKHSPGSSPPLNSAHQEQTIPPDSKTNKRPPDNSPRTKAPSPPYKKQKNATTTQKPTKPRFSSVPAPPASAPADQSLRNPSFNPFKQSSHPDNNPSHPNQSPPQSPAPGKRPRHPPHSSPNPAKSSFSVPKSKPLADARPTRASRRRSDHIDNDVGMESPTQTRHDGRKVTSRGHRSNSSEARRDPDGGRRRRDRDRKREGDRDTSRDRVIDSQKKREADRERRDIDSDEGGRSERGSRRSRRETNSKGQERAERDRRGRSVSRNTSQRTNSEAIGKHEIPASQPSSSRVARTPPLPPTPVGNGNAAATQGAKENLAKESAASQLLSSKRGKAVGKSDLGAIKAGQRELHTAFLASKAKCVELYGKKEYDAYEEEARNAFRLGYDFALARETELRLNEQEFRKMSRKDRSHRKMEIINHYRYLTRNFAQPRLTELRKINRSKTTAYFTRSIQKVYLRIFGLQRLWERDQLEWTKNTQMALDDALKKSTSTNTGSEKAELSKDVLQRVHKITGDYLNMLSIMDCAVTDFGEGYEEAGSECQLQ